MATTTHETPAHETDTAVHAPAATEHATEGTTLHAPTLASETIFHVGSFEIRNTMLMAWIAMIFLIGVGLMLRRTQYKKIPGRFQGMVEMIIEAMFNFFDSIVGDRETTKRFFPLVATIFLFLMFANWMGIFPGVGPITYLGMHEGHEMAMPLFRSMNADVNMTLAVAIISVVCTQLFGVAFLGVLPHMGKYIVAPWKDPVGSFIGILELVAEIAKIISFTFRLFGNIFAGEVLLVVVSFLVPYGAPLPFLGLEIFVGFIQALVFALLTLVFLRMATVSHTAH